MASPADQSARKRARQHLSLQPQTEATTQKQASLNLMDEIDTRAEARRSLEAEVQRLQSELTMMREDKDSADRESARLKVSFHLIL